MLNNINKDFVYGENFKIGSFCVIESGVAVGDNVTIGNGVVLKTGTVIGDNVFIDSNVMSSGKNSIGSRSIVRFSAILCRDLKIGNDCFIAPGVIFLYQDHKKKGHASTVGAGSFIGAGTVINPGINICSKSVIGSMSLITKDIKTSGIYVGRPAAPIADARRIIKED